MTAALRRFDAADRKEVGLDRHAVLKLYRGLISNLSETPRADNELSHPARRAGGRGSGLPPAFLQV